MDDGIDRALIRRILEDPERHPWTIQGTGLLALRLDGRREYRLHVWHPAYGVADPPVHDHPYDFVSQVIVGEVTNTLYEESSSGVEYRRVRYSPPDETPRCTDTVRLAARPAVLKEGQIYSQLAHELHDSRQLPGTVTVIRCGFKDVPSLTVCLSDNGTWVTGKSRRPEPEDVKIITACALERFS